MTKARAASTPPPAPEATPPAGDEAPTADELEALAAAMPPPADDVPPVPASGSLDAPPEAPAPMPAPQMAHVVAGELGIDSARQKPSERLLDEETGEPLDPDTVFQKIEGPGSTLICTRRIVQEINPGEEWSSTTLLVMPAGQVVSQDRADQLLELIRAQAVAE